MLPLVLLVLTSDPFTLWTHHHTLEDGLSQSTVSCMAQDQLGFVWIGTQDGLNRFDGYQFRVYRPEPGNRASIGSPGIQALLCSSNGTLWVGTYQGLNRYDHDGDQFQRFNRNNSDLTDDDIRSICEDENGYIWVGTQNGLIWMDPKTYRMEPFPLAELGASQDVFALYSEGSTLLIGTSKGLVKHDLKTNVSNLFLRDVTVLSISQFYVDSWAIGTQKGLVFIHQNQILTGQYLGYELDGIENPVTALLTDREGFLWCATQGDGLFQFSSEFGLRRVEDPPDNKYAIGDHRIASLMQDQSGLLWIGTYWRGLRTSNPYSLFFSIRRNDDIPGSDPGNRIVRCFLEDHEGALWIGSEGSGITYQPKKGPGKVFRKRHRDPNSLPNDLVFSLMEDDQNQVWIGLEEGNFAKFDRDTSSFQSFRWEVENKSILPGAVRVIHQARGKIWLANDGAGLGIFDPQNHQFFSIEHKPGEPGLAFNRIYAMLPDDRGQLWLGTFGGGLDRLDMDSMTFTHFTEADYPVELDSILALHQTGLLLWIGADGGGLIRLHLDTLEAKQFGQEYFPNLTIYTILDDEKGKLWLSHNMGLSSFDTVTFETQHFEVRDGLQSNEFNGGAGYKSPSGVLYFGGVNGYNRFKGSEIRANPNAPVMVLTQFDIFDRTIAPKQEINGNIPLSKSIMTAENIQLTHMDSVMSLEFAGLSFANPNGVQYEVKMEGFEPTWRELGSRRHVTYTKLDPGRYTFRARAKTHHGIPSSNEAKVQIYIQPPFWKKAWFQALSLLVFLLSLLGIFKWRTHLIEGQNRQLEQQVKARTSELAFQNKRLEDALVELGETKDALIEAAHKAGMADTATGVLHNIGNILNSVNTSAGLIQDKLNKSAISHMKMANDLLRQNMGKIEDFIAHNPKGKKLLYYYLEMEEALIREQVELKESSKRLSNKIEAIREAIAAQQRYAKRHDFYEDLSLSEIVEDALLLQANSIQKHNITVEKKFQTVPKIRIQKTKVIQILINLYQNAKDSMNRQKPDSKVITIGIGEENGFVVMTFSDNGIGIEQERLGTIFQYGYTTKDNGHGFGLHNSANYMTEMEGHIFAKSTGEGKGATFILKFKAAEKLRSDSSFNPEPSPI